MATLTREGWATHRAILVRRLEALGEVYGQREERMEADLAKVPEGHPLRPALEAKQERQRRSRSIRGQSAARQLQSWDQLEPGGRRPVPVAEAPAEPEEPESAEPEPEQPPAERPS